MDEINPVAYFRATKKRGIIWSEDCCCADPVFDDDYDDGYDAAYEALQKENAELKAKNKNLRECIKTMEADQKYQDHMATVKF